MKTRELKLDGKKLQVKSEVRDGLLRAELPDGAIEGSFSRTGPGAGLLTVDGVVHRVATAEHEGRVWVAVDGRVYVFDDARADDEYSAAGSAENSVAAPMPGKVIKVLVENGQEVEEGQPVLIVEAMKMEHTLRAPAAGVVAELKCAEGDQVDAGVPLLELEAGE